MRTKEKKTRCSICGGLIHNIIGGIIGNNAKPINDGRCCDECNNNIVLPRRLTDLANKEVK
tara:strand:- start:71 stop:253 length:183 start_codon:yes stop_codon:yes gene_type:complete